MMSDPLIARDARRQLFAQIPALDALRGVDRFRAEEAIERAVENAIDDYLESLQVITGETWPADD